MEKNDNKQSRPSTTNHFYGPIGQYIEHVEHNHFGMDSEGHFQYADGDSATMQRQLFPGLPTKEMMCQAVAAAVRDGLWYGNQAWAVVYRVYQMKGYMGSMKDFTREVKDWPTGLAASCNYDAVQKPIAKGIMIGPLEKWVANGAPELVVELATTMLTELEKMTNKDTKE